MKTIAVDIDDVLALSAPAFIQYSNRHWGTHLRIDDYHEHWAELWQVNNDVVEQRANDYWGSGVLDTLDKVSNGELVLRYLAENHKLVVATARRKQLEKETTAWINEHFNGIFSEVHFAGMWDKVTDNSIHATKAELCREINADYLIDDQPKHCFAAAAVGIDSILFGNYNWNRVDKLPSGVVRCEDWNNIKDYFDAKR